MGVAVHNHGAKGIVITLENFHGPLEWYGKSVGRCCLRIEFVVNVLDASIWGPMPSGVAVSAEWDPHWH